jgi:hypothetical protein
MRILSILLSLSFVALAATSFEENKGQAGTRVRFLASTPTASVLFTRTGIEFLGLDASGRLETLRLALAGSNDLDWQASGQRPETYHYILAGQPAKVPGGVHRFDRLQASNVYPGIDLLFYFANGSLEYDFIVKPGADASRIQIRLDAPHPVQLSATGEFQSKVGRHPWRQRTPLVYQNKDGHQRQVASHWHPLGNQQFQFIPGTYNTGLPLVVDPVLEFASYLGGEADDEITTIGEGFVAGNTRSNLFDGLNTIPRRGRDIFIRIQASPNISADNMLNWRDQVYIFGGSGDDSLAGAGVIFSQNSLSISFGGTTSSRDFPFSNRPAYKGGDSDAFLADFRLNIGSNSFGPPSSLSGNYYGGSGAERVNSFLAGGIGSYLSGTTDSRDLPVSRAIQTAPGGGRDAFYAFVPINATQAPLISSYFGGAGDDEVHMMRFGPDNMLYIVGETSSESIPLLPGSLAGESDGFLLEIGPSFAINNPPPLDQDLFRRALRFGGSGQDRLKFAGISSTHLLLAGETTSTDLPLVDPIQAKPAGGVDLFVLSLNAERQVIKSTYWGGSSDDFVRVGVLSGSGDLLLAGDTTSTDLPLREAIQTSNKGGRDGFYAFFNPTGDLSYASYFGGAGEDYIYAALRPFSGPLRFAGATSSSDLVSAKAWQPSSAGGTDGFVAEISLPEFLVNDVAWATPGSLCFLNFLASQPLGSTRVTATIGDPNLALFRLGDQRLPSVSWGAATPLIIEGLKESGETTITLSAPGFVSRQLRLRLGRAVINVVSPPSRISTFVSSLNLRFRIDILDTERNELVANSGNFISQPFILPVTWSSSDPSILRIASTTVFGAISIIPVSVGAARISAESSYPFWPEGGLPLEIEPGRLTGTASDIQRANPLTVNTISFRSATPLSPNQSPSISGTFRVTSEDPSRLLLGQGADDLVQEREYEILRQGSLEIPVRALASTGSVRVRVSSPQLAEDAVAIVELTPLLLETRLGSEFSSATATLEALPNTQTNLVASLRFEGGNLIPPSSINGVLNFSVTSSNPSVARPSSATLALGQFTPNSLPISILGQGSAEIRVSSASPHLKLVANPTIKTVEKLPPLFSPNPILVGHKLQTTNRTFLRINLNGQVNAELSVDDPSLALIATSENATPVRSFQFRPFSEVTFVINGMAASGSTSIRLRIPNYEDVVYPVKLGPSGFAFAEDRRSVDVSTGTFTLSMSAWLLDENTLEPILPQALQPNITANLSFASNSADLSLARNSCDLSSRLVCQFAVNFRLPGDYTISLAPVAEFLTPSGRQRLSVRVLRTGLTNTFFYGVKDCLVTTSVQTPFSFPSSTRPIVQPLSLRITSLDPDMVLFSTAADQPGQASITFLSNQNLWIHGMGNTGFARYRLEGTVIETVEATMPVYNWTISVGPQRSNPDLPNNTAIRGTTSEYNVALISTAGQGTAGTRPGIPVISYEVESSDPAVLSYRQAEGEKTFPPGTGFRRGEVIAVGVGSATITPIAGAARAPSLELRVRLPRLTANSLLMVPNARMGLRMRMESGVQAPTDNTIFTVRSLDPSRLLVQRSDSGAPGAPSINAVWPVNSQELSLSLDSLSAAGDSEFEVLLPGFEPFVGKVYIATPALRFSNPQSGAQSLTVGAEATFEVVLGALPRPELLGRTDISTMDQFPFRPGFDPSSIPVGVEIDNPLNLTLLTPGPRLGNGNDRLPLRLRALAAGTARVRLLTPPGFGTFSDSLSVRNVRVLLPEITVNCSTAVAYESMTACSAPAIPGLTIRSASPSRLTISLSETVTGMQEVRTTTQTNSPTFYLHGLASAGTTALTFSAPGYQDRTLNIQHLNSAFVINNTSINPIPVNGTGTVEVVFVAVSSDGRPQQQLFLGLRPGTIPVSVPIRMSDPTVFSVTPASVTFNPGERSKSVQFRGLKSGSATLELGTPAGFAPPLPAGILVRVN